MMVLKVLFFVLSVAALADGFTPISPLKKNINSVPLQGNRPQFHKPSQPLSPSPSRKDTSLSVLLDVPDNFFTFTFPFLGVILSVSNNFGRLRMEERAWEQRVEEARAKRLKEDPTLTEIELRRNEAALEWSAYGKPRMNEERAERERQERESASRSRVQVVDRDDDEDVDDRAYRMTDEEISMFEIEYGVEYDPYYDDAYSEEELPDDIPYNVYKRYGDRIYNNGEIFYKDKESGLYYRQGAKPRNLSFWG